MMEEVSDDTNGESSFEFVGGKSDEPSKDDMKPTAHSPISSERQFPQTTIAPSEQAYNFMQASQPQLASPTFITAPAKGENPIQFYDPTQHADKTVLLPPLTPPSVSSKMPSGMLASVQAQNTHVQQSYVLSDAVPQSFQTSPLPPPPQQQAYFAPQAQHSALALPLPLDGNGRNLHQENYENTMWGWLKGKDFLNKVAEKAKNSVDSVITTLDPGMKEIINSGGDISVIVASGSEIKISAIREAFQHVFGKATVQGVPVQSSSIAPQPVGFSAGLKAAEERINSLRQQGFVHERHVLLAVENFLEERSLENWFDIGCLLLQDINAGISLQVYTQAIPISSHYISLMQEQTPADYPLGWSGFAVTVGQVIGPALGVHHSEWHQALTGVSRREMLFLAAKTIAGLYKAQLRR